MAHDDTLAEFAEALRRLRDQAGSPTYREPMDMQVAKQRICATELPFTPPSG
jgi:hypothetical protein